MQATVTESSGLVMADVGGGILLSDAARLRRWPTVPGERPWQRTARGATSSHAQGPDGTVWFTEAASFAGDEAAVWLVGVDGMTGADRVRLALPTSTETTEHYEPCSASGATRSLVPARVSAPVVDANGDVLVLVETSDTTTRPGCRCRGPAPAAARRRRRPRSPRSAAGRFPPAAARSARSSRRSSPPSGPGRGPRPGRRRVSPDTAGHGGQRTLPADRVPGGRASRTRCVVCGRGGARGAPAPAIRVWEVFG